MNVPTFIKNHLIIWTSPLWFTGLALFTFIMGLIEQDEEVVNILFGDMDIMDYYLDR